ncbi:hypothetical protein ACXR2U_19995, partial [Jatrophihabitans sp. YIM 134969]
MSRPRDFHDPAYDDARRDALTLAALGEPLEPDLASHERDCLVCRADLEGLSRTVGLARGDVSPAPAVDVRPPDAVWTGIARELGLTGPAVSPEAPAGPSRAGAPVGPAGPTEPPVTPPTSLADARRRRRARG